MGAYMYPIKIDYGRKTKKTTKEIRLDGSVYSKKDFNKLLANADHFFFWSDGDTVVLELTKFVPETDKEMNLRIKKGESYMKEYNARQEAKTDNHESTSNNNQQTK